MVTYPSNSSRRKTQRGFTLLEVLIALSIIAITLGALIKTSSDQTANVDYLKQKTIAHWVAMNELNKLLLEKQWPSVGKSKDSIEMARHEWFWQREVLKTASPDTRQVIFTVFSDADHNRSVGRLIGYVTNPEFLPK